MTPEQQRRARLMAEEQQRPLYAVLTGLLARALEEGDG